MPAPTSMISLRLPEDVLGEIDMRVGTSGMRNRSDVIREAVRIHLRDQPTLPSMSSVTIPLGSAVRTRLAKLYELRGISPESAAIQGLLDYVEKAITIETEDLDDLLLARLHEKRAETLPRQEYTE